MFCIICQKTKQKMASLGAQRTINTWLSQNMPSPYLTKQQWLLHQNKPPWFHILNQPVLMRKNACKPNYGLFPVWCKAISLSIILDRFLNFKRLMECNPWRLEKSRHTIAQVDTLVLVYNWKVDSPCWCTFTVQLIVLLWQQKVYICGRLCLQQIFKLYKASGDRTYHLMEMCDALDQSQ